MFGQKTKEPDLAALVREYLDEMGNPAPCYVMRAELRRRMAEAVGVEDPMSDDETPQDHPGLHRDFESPTGCAHCGRPIEPDAVYRCTDCTLPFHRSCAVEHFVLDAVVMGVRSGIGDQVPRWLIDALSRRGRF